MNIEKKRDYFNMKTLSVKSSTNEYNVYIGKQLRHRLQDFIPSHYSAILVITDDTIQPLYLQDIKNNFSKVNIYSSVIPSGEASKNIHTYYDLQTDALTYGLDRQSLIIALGGGVVGDLAGFVAATFMRGIDYVQIPTTILAHDSSVGGKVAINHELGKNLIGNFYPPTAVIYDVETLASLPVKEVRSGVAELIKEGLIADPKLFDYLTSIDLEHLDAEKLSEYLLKGIHVKADIVQRDERESGERKFLNLGHTLAHAIEAEYQYGQITHGEAVAIGLLFAMYVSEQLFKATLPSTQLTHWLKENNYPLNIADLKVSSLIEHMHKDKKAVSQQIQMVLLKKVGQPVTKVIADHLIEKLLKEFIKELN